MITMSKWTLHILIGTLGFVVLLAGTARAEKRVALVIGNSNYQNVSQLTNPKNDAEAISKSLSRLGFEVITGLDVDRPTFIKKIRNFSRAIRGAEIALLFYAGHGLQVNGRNYLAPVETELLDEADLEFETVRLETVMALMEREKRTNLVFLDACRNNPLSRNLARSMGTRSASVGRGLASIESGIGTLIAFATQPGNVALDGDTKNSPFTEALVKHIETPGEDIAVLLRRVRSQVIEKTNGKQVPWSNSSLTGSVILKSKPKEIAKPDYSAEIAFWNSIKQSDEQSMFETYLKAYKDGIFAPLAKSKIGLIVRKREEQQKAIEVARLEERASHSEATRLAEAERLKQVNQIAERETALATERAKQKAMSETILAAERELSSKRKLALEQAQKAQKKSEAARVAMQKRLVELEANRKPILQPQLETAGKNLQIASLDQSHKESTARIELEAKPPEPTKVETENKKELARSIQKELNRVGCSAGKPDGLWGKGSRKALIQYGRHNKIKIVSLDPSKELLDRLKATQTRICPLICRSGFEEKGNSCVRIKRQANINSPELRKKSTDKKTPAKNSRTKTKKKTASANNCPSNATRAAYASWDGSGRGKGRTSFTGRHKCGRNISCSRSSTSTSSWSCRWN